MNLMMLMKDASIPDISGVPGLILDTGNQDHRRERILNAIIHCLVNSYPNEVVLLQEDRRTQNASSTSFGSDFILKCRTKRPTRTCSPSSSRARLPSFLRWLSGPTSSSKIIYRNPKPDSWFWMSVIDICALTETKLPQPLQFTLHHPSQL